MSAVHTPLPSETNTDDKGFSLLSFIDDKADDSFYIGDADDLYRQKLPSFSNFFKTLFAMVRPSASCR